MSVLHRDLKEFHLSFHFSPGDFHKASETGPPSICLVIVFLGGFIFYLFVSGSVCHLRVSPLKGQKELLDPLELARVTGSWELSDMGAEIELKSSKRA